MFQPSLRKIKIKIHVVRTSLGLLTYVHFLQHSHFHHFRKISSYFPEDFQKKISYFPETFRIISSYFPEDFRKIIISRKSSWKQPHPLSNMLTKVNHRGRDGFSMTSYMLQECRLHVSCLEQWMKYVKYDPFQLPSSQYVFGIYLTRERETVWVYSTR
jgi:hypothetical protein